MGTLLFGRWDEDDQGFSAKIGAFNFRVERSDLGWGVTASIDQGDVVATLEIDHPPCAKLSEAIRVAEGLGEAIVQASRPVRQPRVPVEDGAEPKRRGRPKKEVTEAETEATS